MDNPIIKWHEVVKNRDYNLLESILSDDIIGSEMYYLYLNKDDGDSLNDRIPFFGEKGEIEINTRLSTFESSAKISGSKNQLILEEYNSMIRRFNTEKS